MEEQLFLDFISSSQYRERVDWSKIDIPMIVRMVKDEMPDTYEVNDFLERVASRCGSLVNTETEYDRAATLILMTIHDHNTEESFLSTVRRLQENRDISGRPRPILSEEFVDFIENNALRVEEIFTEHMADCFMPSLFGWKTLTRAYLMRANGKIVERLPHLMMRIALFIHKDNWEDMAMCYRDLLAGRYTHATPTLFAAGTRRSQMASCFTADARVWTTDGVRRIRDVKVGDEVLTHTGMIRRVIQVHSNKRRGRRLYHLFSSRGYAATATGDHQFYCYDKRTDITGWKRLDEMDHETFILRAHRKQSVFPRAETRLSDKTNELLTRFPEVVGWAIGSGATIYEDFMDVHIYGAISSIDTGLFKVQAGVIHIRESSILEDLRLWRLVILEWVLRHGVVEFVQGLQDVFSEEKTLYIADNKERERVLMLMNTFLEGKYVLEGDNVRLDSPTHPMGCCGLWSRKERDVVRIGQREYCRFREKVRAVKEEATHDVVYTLGVEEDHSYIVGGLAARNCFLMGTEDSVAGIFKTISDAAQISKWAGGIGIHLSNIRAKKSYIYGTNGYSNGIMPMLRVYNHVSRYIDQCFSPDVRVATKDGMRPIGEVRAGDLVMDRNGVYSPVAKVLSYDWDGEVWNIDGRRVTPDHDFLAPDGEYRSLGDASDADRVVFPDAIGRTFGDMVVKREDYIGKVIDLEMEGEPSYVTEIGTVHNGGGKRNGAFAMYIEPWHADIYDFVNAKRNAGAEDDRARDLFYGLWIPDLFMERIERDEMWSLFCPSVAPGLSDVIGPEFKSLYESYEEKGIHNSRVRARDLWSEILRSQIETGTPYMLYKDACNYRSNQKNLGVIKSSNLCVSGETRILTPRGWEAIGRLSGETVKVWNGESFATVDVHQTGKDQELVRVSFSHGAELLCTPYHHFYVERNGQTMRVEARELSPLDRITPFHLPSPPEKIPSAIMTTIRWVSKTGIYAVDHVRVYSSDRESLISILLDLQACGIHSKIIHFPLREMEFELRIPRNDVWKHIESVSSESLAAYPRAPGQRVDDIIVVGVVAVGHKSDTFCFTEPETGKGMFEGVVTGQCTEIIEYSDSDEYACCNLASIALPRFLKPNPKRKMITSKKVVAYTKKDCPFCLLLALEYPDVEKRDIEEHAEDWQTRRKVHALTTVPAIFIDQQYVGGFTDFWKSHLSPVFDFDELHRVVRAVTANLNRVIDLNIYPLKETETSNKRHRPIGIGVQGLADVFGKMRLMFDEEDARTLNRHIFETIYHAALSASNEMAIRDGPYSTFKGSPLSEGKFHFELTSPVMDATGKKDVLSCRYDWEALRSSIIKNGTRNSLLIAPMPTASTSQILGNTECFEPWTSNVFLRRTIAGEFYICNSLLQRDMEALGLWNKDVMDRLIRTQGSVAKFPIPVYLKNIYRTVWEIPQRSLIDMAVDRQYFIDQSQSLNIFVSEPSLDLLTKIHFYGWKKGLKTGCYYIRSRAPVSAINYGLSPPEEEGCVSCSA